MNEATGPQGIQAFITKWEVSGAAERANAQLFIAELYDVIDVDDAPAIPAATQRPWPKDLPAQAAALTEVLGTLVAPASVEEIAGLFSGKSSKKRVDEVGRLLETLGAVGRAQQVEGQWSSGG